MSSLKSKLILWSIRNRHLFKYPFRREIVTQNSSIEKFRAECLEGAKKYSCVPDNLCVESVEIPGNPPVYAEWIHPIGVSKMPSAGTKAIFYTHGGGYVSGNCMDHRNHVMKFVMDTGISALLYDYRLAPENPFPAAMEDTLTAYRWLLNQGVQSSDVIVVGESAGGGLCLASLLAFRDEKLAMPSAGVALSPWTDLKCTGKSYQKNMYKDISTLGSWEVWSKYYYGSYDPGNPWISPLYGDLSNLPPVMIVVGDHEILLDDSLSYAEKARNSGTDLTLRVWQDMVHCFPLFSPLFSEATQAWNEIIQYIRNKLCVTAQ